jgi:hypothetical protein
MKAKDLLKKVMRNYMDIECSGVIEISEDSPVSVYFNVADECDVEEGEYFYTYLEDEQEMKDTEKFLGQPFDYAFPLRDSDGWVGIIKVE